MNKQILTQPFAPEQVKERTGAHGKNFKYVDVASVVTRLNEGCDAWDFYIDKYEVHDEEVLVQGRLVADGVSKCAFGGSSVTVDKQGKVISIPDDLKAAASDALKKCASLLGVGLEMYGGQAATSTTPKAAPPSPTATRTTRSASTKPATSASPTTGTMPASTTSARSTSSADVQRPRQAVPEEDPSERATVRQLAAIHSASRRRGYNREALAMFVSDATGKKDLSHLTRGEATTVIDGLNQVQRPH